MILKKVFSAISFLSLLLLMSCGGDDNNIITPTYPKNVKVTYKVTGTVKTGDITFTNASGGSDNLTINPPFTKEIDMTVQKAPFGIAIAITAYEGGTANLEISVDGKVVDTKSYSGTTVITGSATYVFK